MEFLSRKVHLLEYEFISSFGVAFFKSFFNLKRVFVQKGFVEFNLKYIHETYNMLKITISKLLDTDIKNIISTLQSICHKFS